jgi:hypothetical protein
LSYVENGSADISDNFEFAIEEADITTFSCDVIVLKYAQRFYGADRRVAELLEHEGLSKDTFTPLPKQYRYIETTGSIRSHFALFIGVQPGSRFKYRDVRDFGGYAIDIISKKIPHAKHIAMTIHGVGFGLDEAESFLAQFAGIQDSLLTNRTSQSIKRVSIVDKDHNRVQRLRSVLRNRFASVDYGSELEPDGSLYRIDIKDRVPRVHYGDVTKDRDTLVALGSIDLEGIESEKKPHVFVAMPFHEDFEDVFYFGIQEPVKAAGLLCERVDNEAFMGDVLEQVKKRIETAAVVIAVLTGANPNVYLEIGYAWGRGRQTILLVKEEEPVKFDVRGQRHLKYTSIKALSEALREELKQLKSRNLF